ncbi:hypothetical protein BVRB_6g145540 [Beta vulgaris subsp. vulgaris]|nr:hypothetical protein BVRB_6g145540 [Beta vulgaris subsp. vulgaris]
MVASIEVASFSSGIQTTTPNNHQPLSKPPTCITIQHNHQPAASPLNTTTNPHKPPYSRTTTIVHHTNRYNSKKAN